MRYVIFGFAILFVIHAIAILINRAPEGFQDENGFHCGKSKNIFRKR